MQNQILIFTNSQFGEIRTIKGENIEPWFVGKDVATLLGYKDASKAICDRVDEEDKTSLLIQQSGSNYKAKTSFINESGLYSLILSSKHPQAKAFKHWVTSEVLPSIRNHGVYLSDQSLENARRLGYCLLWRSTSRVCSKSKFVACLSCSIVMPYSKIARSILC